MSKEANIPRGSCCYGRELTLGRPAALIIIKQPHSVILEHTIGFIERFHSLFIPSAIRMVAGCPLFVKTFNVLPRTALTGTQNSVVVFVRIKLAHGVPGDCSFGIFYLQLFQPYPRPQSMTVLC